MASGVNYSIAPFKNDIEHWITKFEMFVLTSYETCNYQKKLAILITVIGDDAECAIKNFAATEKDTYAHLKAKLLVYYKPSVNFSTYRHEFYSMYQEVGETVDYFVNRLKDNASKCGFKVE